MKMMKMAKIKATEVNVTEVTGSNPAFWPSPPHFREEREREDLRTVEMRVVCLGINHRLR